MTFPCSCLLLSGLMAGAGQPRVVLVEDGRPVARLVLPAEPSRPAQLAAYEIQHHVALITGATLPIVHEGEAGSGAAVYLGATQAARAAGLDAAGLAPQEYVVQLSPDAVYLLGPDEPDHSAVVYDPAAGRYENLPGCWDAQGTLYAAYDFLERFCGVRWLNQTDLGTAYSQSKTLAVSGPGVRRAPAFAFRDACGANGDNPAIYDEYVELWAKGTPEFDRWEQAAHADLHRQFPDAGRYQAVKRGLAQLFLLRSRNGGELQRCNHSLYGYYDRFWRDPATRRAGMFAKGYQGEPPQLCYTSRELIQQVAQDACDYYDGRKTGRDLQIFWQPRLPNLFPVEPMDNSSFCRCDECQSWLTKDTSAAFSTGIYSDYFFHFVDQVAQELNRTHPGRGLVTLAYASHAAPPQRVKLNPSVAVQFCFATNRGGVGTKEYQHELDLLRAWSREARTSHRKLYLWLYYTFPVESARNANLPCWPGFFAHSIGEQMRLFQQLGYQGMFHCGFGQEVEAYVTFRLQNDPTLSVDALLDEYFRGLYGPAAGPLLKLYEEIERTHAGQAPAYTPARMAQLGALLDRARKLAHTGREQRNLELFALGTWSYMQEGFAEREKIRTTKIPAQSVPRLPDAGGDAAKLVWDRAAVLAGPWYRNNSDHPAGHKLSGRIAHDGRWLYLELTDDCDVSQLKNSAMVFPLDDWEVFVARQRAMPYRQYASSPAGLTVALSHGEVNFRTNVPIDKPPFTVTSDTSAPHRWVTRMVWPLADIVPHGVKPGGKLYLNVIRVWALGGDTPGIDAWGPFTKVHDVTRLPELALE